MLGGLFDGKIRFERDLVTTSIGLNRESILALLREQFEGFHWEKRARGGWTITGKSGGGKQDDCLIAVLMNYKFGLDLHCNRRHAVFTNVPRELLLQYAKVKECE